MILSSAHRKQAPGHMLAGTLAIGLALGQPDKLWAQSAETIEPPSSSSASFSACSTAFHGDLKRINFVFAEPLREAVLSGRTRDKSRSRDLTLPVPRVQRSNDLSKAINFASRSSRGQGSDSWLRSEGGRWLTESISVGLVRYTGQDESPFLCTGMEGYLGYLQPHQKKLTRINTTREGHFDVALAAVDPAFEEAWLSMRPIPLPKFRPARAEDEILSEELSPLEGDGLRSGLDASQPVQRLDETTTGSTEIAADIPDDVQPLSEPEGQFEIAAVSDGAGAVETLFERLVETGNLPADAPSPILGTGGDPASIVANTRDWIRGNAPAIANPLVRRQVWVAMSAYEVAATIDANSHSLRIVEDRMQRTFEAIRASHAKHCVCQ